MNDKRTRTYEELLAAKHQRFYESCRPMIEESCAALAQAVLDDPSLAGKPAGQFMQAEVVYPSLEQAREWEAQREAPTRQAGTEA